MADTFSSAAALLAHRSPVDPVVGLRPHLIQARARRILAAFPGDVLYAVKCNDAPEVLQALWAGGVRQFDTASIGEVRAARGYGRTVGITFHVGSQCVDPAAYTRAIALAAAVVRQVGPVDDLDVGGGFPARYQGDEPEFEAFVAAIRESVSRHGLVCRLQCEPGRALVADGASTLARVELRRGNSLYLNDGVYGNLAELKWIGPRFPMRLVRPADGPAARPIAFDLFGPTCDSIDSMPGPHWLPSDTDEGDWVEVGMMGAYSNALKTGFNGFGSERMAILDDSGWYLRGGERRTEAVSLAA